MQCPIVGMCCCLMSPKTILFALGVLDLALGGFSMFRPEKSIRLYQWVMERFNWRVTPVDRAKEIRNTARMGFWLLVLGGMLVATAIVKF